MLTLKLKTDMTENQERAEQARSAFTVNGGNVQILPNATIAIQNIHWGDGTVTRTERWITPANRDFMSLRLLR